MIFGKKGDDQDSGDFKALAEKLQSDNKTLREALEFYADPANWEAGHKYRDVDDATIFTDGNETSVSVDKGTVAKRALNACK